MNPGDRFRTSGGEDGHGAFMPSDPTVEAFLAEIIEVCKKHGMSIAHEDRHGGFLIQKFSQSNIDWLMDASDDR